MSFLATEGFTAPKRFEVVRRIGAGGMGVVYEALDRERDLRVALKHLAEPSPATLYLFKREFHALAGIVHPNLVPLYELISDGQQWFFTMELIDQGVDFIAHLRKDRPRAVSMAEQLTLPSGPGPVTVVEGPPLDQPARPASDEPAVDYGHLRDAFIQLATGVAALHQAGKLHRDLKPSNAMVRQDGRVVLVDFGLVVEISAYAASSTDPAARASRSPLVPLATDAQLAGSIAYMAPEQAAGQALTCASDWYAVGAMLFEALTGRLPIEGEPIVMWNAKQFLDAPAPSQLVSDIPADLDALCVELLRRDPAARPSGAEVLARLAGGVAPGATGVAPALATHLAPFVGRVAHLDKLRRAFDEAAGGHAVVCRVIGKSGAGKTSLIHRFIDETALRREVTVLAGRCYEQESVPYKTVDNVVDALASHLVRLPADDVARLLPANLPALTRVFPAFERIATWSDATYHASHVHDPRELRQLAFEALRELLVGVSRRRPLLVYIDDVQWGDVDGATLLAGLLEPRAGLHMLLVIAYRSEDEEVNPCLAALATSSAIRAASQPGGTVIVDALTAAETCELALDLIGRETPGAAARAAWVVRESFGDALFIHELVRHLEAGFSTASAEGTPLDDVLWRRVCRLPDDARRLLEIIAVAGQPIRLRTAQEAADLPALPPEVVTGLRAGQLVRGTGPSLDDDIHTFHDRIRESVVAHLPEDTRKAHHARLAVTLEAAGGVAPETIAAHFHGAGELGKAADYYVAAADLAMRALAFERAEGYYRQAAELAQTDLAKAAVWEKMIHYYTNMARFADAYAVGRTAVERFGVALPARFIPPVFLVDFVRASIRLRGREPARLLELPAVSDPRIEAAVRLICVVAKAAYQLRPELCVAISTKVVNLCLRYGNTRHSAIAYLVFGTIFQGGVLGRHETGHAFGRLALALVEKYENTAHLSEVAFVVGYFGISWLRPATEAEALWRTAYDAGQRTDDLFHTGCACAGTVMSMMMRGAPLAEVREESERHVDFLQRRGLREPLAVLATVRRARALLGAPAGDETPCVEAELDEAAFERRLAGFGSKHFVHFHYVLLAGVHYLLGNHDKAALAVRTSASYLKESPGMLHTAEHELWSALIAAAQVRRAAGVFRRAQLVRAAKRARRKLARWAADCPENFASKERLVAGELARLRGDAAEAVRCYAAAVAAAEDAGHLHIAGLAHELAASVHAATGHPDAARRVEDAKRYYDRWGATLLSAGVEVRISA
jgi:serine/threonine protein kinase/predicted ATPase